MKAIDREERKSWEEGVASAVFEALPANAALLDAAGVVVLANAAWRRFARENGAAGEAEAVGQSYLAVCAVAAASGDAHAAAALAALQAVLAGERRELELEYPCSSPTVERWFSARFARVPVDGRLYVLTVHTDITARHLAARALREQERLLQTVLDALPSGVWLVDDAGEIRYANAASRRVCAGETGAPPSRLADCRGWLDGEGRPVDLERWAVARVLAGGEATLEETVRIARAGGARKVVLLSAIPLAGADGSQGALVVTQDVTDQRRAETALAEREAQLRQLFAILPVGVAVLDAAGGVRESNPALAQVLHLPAADVGAAIRRRRYFREDGTEFAPDEFPSAIAIREQRPVQDVEIAIRDEQGAVLWASVSAAPLPSPDARAVVVTSDITARKETDAALRRAQLELEAANRDLVLALAAEKTLARTDALTGVGNRLHFFDVAAQEIARARRRGEPLSVILFDVDRFKDVNDARGHDHGDAVLCAVARRLADGLRESDLVARMGGDEFVVLLPETDGPSAALIADRLRSGASLGDGDPLGPVSLSAGVAEHGAAEPSIAAALQRADRALYAAKSAGRNRSVLL